MDHQPVVQPPRSMLAKIGLAATTMLVVAALVFVLSGSPDHAQTVAGTELAVAPEPPVQTKLAVADPSAGSMCQSQRDVVMLVDSSGSVLKYYNGEKAILAQAASSFNIGPSTTHMGILQFSYNIKAETMITSDSNKVMSVIDKMRAMIDGTWLSRGINGAVDMIRISEWFKSGIPRTIILISDGQNSFGKRDLIRACDKARAYNVTVYVIAVGQPNFPILSLIADRSNIYTITDVLTQLQPTMADIVKRECGCPNNCGHGTCDKNGVCECPVGWSGVDCNTPICDPDCGRGTCTGPNTCSCPTGWKGESCKTPTCSPECNAPQTCIAPNTCTNGCFPECKRGTCNSDVFPAKCTCPTGWTGADCDTPICNPVCQHGKCTAPDTCTCDPGWLPADCSTPKCDPECVNGKCKYVNGASICVCDDPWIGATCSVKPPAGPFCNPGCKNGKCTATDTCTCDEGWTGKDCGTPKCDPECSEHGTCMYANGKSSCVCDSPWTGDSCSVKPPEGPFCNPGCKNGKCTATDTCTCDEGWTGKDCGTPKCDPECVNGKCVNVNGKSSCVCDSPWIGAACSVKPPVPPPAPPAPPTPSPHSGGCGSTSPVDVVFVTDSGAVLKSYGDFKKIQGALDFAVDNFNVGSSTTHVGLVNFAAWNQMDSQLTGSVTDLKQGIKDSWPQGGSSFLDQAIGYANTMLITAGRPKARKAIVAVTAGIDMAWLGTRYVDQAKADGVTIYTVAVNGDRNPRDVDLPYLASMASGTNYAFNAGNYDGLKLAMQNVIAAECN